MFSLLPHSYLFLFGDAVFTVSIKRVLFDAHGPVPPDQSLQSTLSFTLYTLPSVSILFLLQVFISTIWSYRSEPITTLSHYSPYYMYSYLYDKGDQDQKEKLRSIFIQINKLYVYQYLYTKDPSFSCSMFLSSDKVACSCLNRILDVADATTRDQISTIAPLFNMNQYLIYYHRIEVLLCCMLFFLVV